MAGKADVQTHLAKRHDDLTSSVADWAKAATSATGQGEVVEQYLTSADVGLVRRVGPHNAAFATPTFTDKQRPSILVVGSHDLASLSEAPGPALLSDPKLLRGAGLGTTFGPFMAFLEGFLAARTRTGENPVNASFLSLGHQDRLETIASSLLGESYDAIFVTNAVAWNPTHATITTGARGHLLAEISVTSGQEVDDFTTAGAVRNPLNKLVEALGALRDDRGRIVLPGFYDRAHAPGATARAALHDDGHNPNDWATSLNASRPNGALSATERASMWPVVSLLNIDGGGSNGTTTPGSASATIAIYLVPGQRHAQVESSLRAWIESHLPADMNPAIKVLASSRPYVATADSVPVAAQTRAAFRLTGRRPVLVPAGGPAGSGEMALSTGAPVAFAGLSGPQHGFGSLAETLPRSLFDASVAHAAETCIQLRRA